MILYKHILAAIDLSDEARPIINKAQQLAEFFKADLSLIHVLEPVPAVYGTDVPMYLGAVEGETESSAETRLQKLSETINLSTDRQYLRIGKPKREIHTFAENNNIDLIVIGSHGRDGFELLLGSTANAVLHGACCDVLTVRVGEK